METFGLIGFCFAGFCYTQILASSKRIAELEKKVTILEETIKNYDEKSSNE